MLRGRTRESRTIDELLSDARASRSGALVILGEPGIGKTALLNHAAAADDLQILQTTGIEAEAELAFASLHLLFGPVLSRLDRIPERQAAALRGAFGLGPAGTGDRFLIGLAVLSLLAELAEDGPVLCLVDDAQWLDRASADALVIAARRLAGEGVAMLLAARTGFTAPGLPVLELAGLDEVASGEVLNSAARPLTAEFRQRILAEAAGNPLALLELPKSGESQGELSLTTRLEEGFAHQVDGLSTAARVLLQVAAADATADPAIILAAARTLGCAPEHLEEISAAGLIRTADGSRLEFRHPLVRAAVWQRTPLARRLAVHHALSHVLEGTADADRSAWHLAAATLTADEQVAARLEATAARAHVRSGYAAAASAYERAAALSPSADERARRLTLAAEATEFSGRFDRARTLALGAGNPGAELTSRLIRVRACSDYGEGHLQGAHAMLSAGVDHLAATDPSSAAWLLLDAASMIWLDGDRDMAHRTAEQLDALRVPPDADVVAIHQLCRWFVVLALARPSAGLPPLAQVIESARAQAGPDRRGLLLIGGLGLADHDARTHQLALAATATIRAEGRIGLLPQALTFLSRVEYARGRYADARGFAEEAASIAADTGQPAWSRLATILLDQLAAVHGDPLDPASANPAALTLLDLGQGRPEQALLGLEALVYGKSRNRTPAMHLVPDLVEAAVRSGRNARAAEPFTRLESWAEMLHQRWADALVSRCRALLSTTPDADAHFRAALASHERPFGRARTELLYGEWLRRARQTSDAQEHLRAALEAFEWLGARPWAERARTELGATGWSTQRNTGADRCAQLTPQERQIVRLAAQGLSNKDIAAHLFLSPRTVGQHLYKAFPKLGVTARTQLAKLTLSD
ncbi:helix-turn-helix transcriptional regulator [Nonomuraea mesophila]|uniref:Helix-turn-helix transcriptional regulator n=1 Tax=Nonomuraea mesophila TaxID=2530382 RepID=A0A4R5FVS5_9ACTN|nr:helix-turn-helix transcriptional regulator [Nonomuraea mesophila]TDE57722.1 helix-turn-helix transcriptional regulator [Nonomuraea mesophila]